jgi:hypothetical protein
MTERGTKGGNFPTYEVGETGTFNNRKPLNKSVGAPYKPPKPSRSVLINAYSYFDTDTLDPVPPPALRITESIYDGFSGTTGFVSPPRNEWACCEDGDPKPKAVGLVEKVYKERVNLGVKQTAVKKASPDEAYIYDYHD